MYNIFEFPGKNLTKPFIALPQQKKAEAPIVLPEWATTSKLRWAIPDTTDYTVTNVPSNANFFGPARTAGLNYLERGQAGTRGGTYQTNNGKNIVFLGCTYNWNPSSGTGSVGVSIRAVSDLVYIEGQDYNQTRIGDAYNIFGKAQNGTNKDPFAAYYDDALFPDVVFQNGRILNINGSEAGHHADPFQAAGSIRDFKMHRYTITGNYQGLFLTSQTPIRDAYLSNINFRWSGVSNDIAVPKFLWFWDSQAHYDANSPRSLRNVYVDNVWIQPIAGFTAADHIIICGVSAASLNPVFGTDELGEYFSFPQFPRLQSSIYGGPARFRSGTPAGGDIVTASGIGGLYSNTLGYVDGALPARTAD